ncbi:hypothetical protein GCM10027614_51310 [Micromonospora vulcania]
MQPSIFNPWDWRDPSALAGGYEQATPSVTPPDGRTVGTKGRTPRSRHSGRPGRLPGAGE